MCQDVCGRLPRETFGTPFAKFPAMPALGDARDERQSRIDELIREIKESRERSARQTSKREPTPIKVRLKPDRRKLTR